MSTVSNNTDTSVTPVAEQAAVLPSPRPSATSGLMWVKGTIERPSHTLVKGWDKTNQRLVELMSYHDNPDPELEGVQRGDFVGYATTSWEAREVREMGPDGVERTVRKPGGSRQEAIPADQM